MFELVDDIAKIPRTATPMTIYYDQINIGATSLPDPHSIQTWQDYYSKLPEFDQQVLELFANWDDSRISATNRDLEIATDGSVKTSQGTFGIIVSTEDKVRILEMSGTVQGWNPSSYRAELFGALVLCLLCHHLQEYQQDTEIFKCQIYINNKSAVNVSNKIQNHQTLEQILDTDHDKDKQFFYKIDHLTLTPEWDLIAQLNQFLKDPKYLDWTFSWIAGHQDRKTTYDKLTLQAQLNCDADKLAGYQQDKIASETPWLVALTQACPVHLDINSPTVTSKYKSAIRSVGLPCGSIYKREITGPIK